MSAQLIKAAENLSMKNKFFPRGKYGQEMPGEMKPEETDLLTKQMRQFVAYSTAARLTRGVGASFKPDCMFGSLPLYYVTKMDVAKSDRLMKFRAVGGHFFAYQEADNMQMIVELDIVGSFRFVFLHALNMIYYEGLAMWEYKEYQDGNWIPGTGRRAEVQLPDCTMRDGFAGKIFNANTPDCGIVGLFGGTRIHYEKTPAGTAPNPFQPGNIKTGGKDWDTKLMTSTADPSGGPADPTNRETWGKAAESDDPLKEIPNYQTSTRRLAHKTFNVICEEEVFTRMYIETLIWRKDVGSESTDSLHIHCLLRRYIDPPEHFFIDAWDVNESLSKQKVGIIDVNAVDKAKDGVEQARKAALTPDTMQIKNTGQELTFTGNGSISAKDQYKAFILAFGTSKKPSTRKGQITKATNKWKITSATDSVFNVAKYNEKLLEIETEMKKARVMVTEDEWKQDIEHHRWLGTVKDTEPTGDWQLLNINLAWRMYWTQRNILKGGLMNLLKNGVWPFRISSSPVIGRICMVANAMTWKSAKKPTNTVATINYQSPISVPPPSDDIRAGSGGGNTGILGSEWTASGTDQYFIEKFGIPFEVGKHSLEDYFQAGQRQNIFNKMIYYGFKSYKIQGFIEPSINLGMSEPIDCNFSMEVNSSPYQENPIPVYFNYDRFKLLVTSGSLYYLGTGGNRTWEKINDQYYRINCKTRDEMWLWVKEYSYTSEAKVLITAFIIIPAHGI